MFILKYIFIVIHSIHTISVLKMINSGKDDTFDSNDELIYLLYKIFFMNEKDGFDPRDIYNRYYKNTIEASNLMFFSTTFDLFIVTIENISKNSINDDINDILTLPVRAYIETNKKTLNLSDMFLRKQIKSTIDTKTPGFENRIINLCFKSFIDIIVQKQVLPVYCTFFLKNKAMSFLQGEYMSICQDRKIEYYDESVFINKPFLICQNIEVQHENYLQSKFTAFDYLNLNIQDLYLKYFIKEIKQTITLYKQIKQKGTCDIANVKKTLIGNLGSHGSSKFDMLVEVLQCEKTRHVDIPLMFEKLGNSITHVLKISNHRMDIFQNMLFSYYFDNTTELKTICVNFCISKINAQFERILCYLESGNTMYGDSVICERKPEYRINIYRFSS